MNGSKVTLDFKEALAAINALELKAPNAIARAINRAADSGRTAMTSSISKDTGLRSKDVRGEIKVHKATPAKLGAALSVAGKRLPLVMFRATGPDPSRGKGRGVSYKLPTGRGRVATAFFATMKSGHRGVFRRVGTARLGITELHGPSLPKVFEKFIPVGQARANEMLLKNLRNEIRFATTR